MKAQEPERVPAFLGGTEVHDFLRTLFVTIVLFFVEMHFLRLTLQYPDVLRFPLFSTDLANNPHSFYFLEVIYLGSMLAMSWRRWIIPAGVIGAIAGFCLLNLDLRARYQFDYLPMWTFLAFALSEALIRTERFKNWGAFPFIVVMVAIYDFAIYHKVINYTLMLSNLRTEVWGMSEGSFGPLCTNADCLILHMIAWGTIPIETILGVLTASKRWLRPRLLFVIAFHWMVAIMAEVIAVSFMMLLIHVIVAHLQSPQTQIFKKRQWGLLAVCEIFWFLGDRFFYTLFPVAWQPCVLKLCWVSLFLWPIIFLMLPFLRDPVPEEKKLPSLAWPEWTQLWKKPTPVGVATLAFVAANLLFGFAPLLMDEQYSVYNVGWAMFSGGYQRNAIKTLNTPAMDCYAYPNVYGLIYGQKQGDHFSYTAKRQVDLDRLSDYFENVRKCPK